MRSVDASAAELDTTLARTPLEADWRLASQATAAARHGLIAVCQPGHSARAHREAFHRYEEAVQRLDAVGQKATQAVAGLSAAETRLVQRVIGGILVGLAIAAALSVCVALAAHAAGGWPLADALADSALPPVAAGGAVLAATAGLALRPLYDGARRDLERVRGRIADEHRAERGRLRSMLAEAALRMRCPGFCSKIESFALDMASEDPISDIRFVIRLLDTAYGQRDLFAGAAREAFLIDVYVGVLGLFTVTKQLHGRGDAARVAGFQAGRDAAAGEPAGPVNGKCGPIDDPSRRAAMAEVENVEAEIQALADRIYQRIRSFSPGRQLRRAGRLVSAEAGEAGNALLHLHPQVVGMRLKAALRFR